MIRCQQQDSQQPGNIIYYDCAKLQRLDNHNLTLNLTLTPALTPKFTISLIHKYTVALARTFTGCTLANTLTFTAAHEGYFSHHPHPRPLP